MKLNRPKNITFILAVIVALLGIISQVATVPGISAYAFWLVVIAFILLAAGNLFEGV